MKAGFLFGNAMTREILDNLAYEQWCTSRFTVTPFANKMKWYNMELRPNHEDYRVLDAMLQLVEQHDIKVHGHNVFWSD
jgi:GH35 family endo-1,4-beta-xylanase